MLKAELCLDRSRRCGIVAERDRIAIGLDHDAPDARGLDPVSHCKGGINRRMGMSAGGPRLERGAVDQPALVSIGEEKLGPAVRAHRVEESERAFEDQRGAGEAVSRELRYE